MINGFLNLPWFVWAALAMVLATVWIYVGPHTRIPATPGVRNFFVRWGHALTWLLLAINFVLRGMDPTLTGAANLFGAAGGMAYLLFMVMTLLVK